MSTKILAIVATTMAVAGIGILPSMASAESLFEPTIEVSPQVKEDCPPGDVCVWEGPTFGGNRAFFAGSETGTHTLENITPHSAYNHTGNHTAVFPEWYFGSCCPNLILSPGQSESNRTSSHHTTLIIS